MTDAMMAAKTKLLRAAGTWNTELEHETSKMIKIFKEKNFGKTTSVQICRSFREFVLSVNYKELSSCISSIKKAIERVQQPTYLSDLVLKIFTFESGSKEMYSQIKMDLSVITDRAI
jgi:hypothetical protein